MDHGLPALGEGRLRIVRLAGLQTPLRLLTPPSVDELLDRIDVSAPDAEDRIPYWAELWPSGAGLAHWLLAGGGPRRPGRALEIGCGLGLVGLVALRLGWDIVLSDRDETACLWAARNLALNGFDPDRVRRLDWREAAAERFDSILGADVLYERAFAPPLLRFLDSALAPGGRALLAEPGRPVAEDALALFAERGTLRIHAGRCRVRGRWRPLRILEIGSPGGVPPDAAGG